MITTRQKICIILLLSAAFSLFLMFLANPFMGEHYQIKKDLHLIEQLTMNQEQNFSNLPYKDKHHLTQSKAFLLKKLESSFFEKSSQGISELFTKTPKYALLWIVFSIIIGIACLKEIEGAKRATLLLPLITILYGVDRPLLKNHPTIYPTEKTLVQDYLKKPLSSSLKEQRDELNLALDLWMIDQYADKKLILTAKDLNELRKNGRYNFDLALFKNRFKANFEPIEESENALFYLCYLAANIGLATVFNWRSGKNKSLEHSPQMQLK